MPGRRLGGQKQYTRFCYTDVLALYYAEGLNEGKVPYLDHPVEYPVLTGAFMGVLGLPVHALGDDRPEINQGQWFYNLNALVLGALARRHGRGAPRAAPATTLGRGDVRAVARAVRSRRPSTGTCWPSGSPRSACSPGRGDTGRWPACCSASAAAAKLWPLFLLGPILVLALRTGRWRAALITIGTGVADAGCWSTCRSRSPIRGLDGSSS